MTKGFECDLAGFTKQVVNFCRKAQSGTYTDEALDLGMRTLRLHYLNMTGDEADALIASGFLEHAARQHAAAILLYMAQPLTVVDIYQRLKSPEARQAILADITSDKPTAEIHRAALAALAAETSPGPASPSAPAGQSEPR